MLREAGIAQSDFHNLVYHFFTIEMIDILIPIDLIDIFLYLGYHRMICEGLWSFQDFHKGTRKLKAIIILRLLAVWFLS